MNQVLLFVFLFFSTFCAQAQTQLGQDIDGEAASDWSGRSISLDGNRVAIGAHLNDGTAVRAGHVRVYEYVGSNWVQLGADIDGQAMDDQSGFSVSLSGNRVAVGAPTNNTKASNAGQVRVYEYNGTSWLQLGEPINGEAGNDESGYSVSLDGDRVAIGAPKNSGNGTTSGQVRVFSYNGTTWNQLGADIDGEAVGDELGRSVSLQGNRLAAGAPLNDGSGANAGHVRIYELSGTDWLQLGADIDGEAAGDESGSSISLDGDKVAIGAYLNDGKGTNSGHARVFAYNGSSWQKLGADIDGESVGDQNGYSVSLQQNRLAVGAPGSNSNGSDAGKVKVYDFDGTEWKKKGRDLIGEMSGDFSGWSVSLDNDLLAVSAYLNDGNGLSSGHVRVFSLEGLVSIYEPRNLSAEWTQLLSVYPNPISDSPLHVEGLTSGQRFTISIVDVLGKVHLRSTAALLPIDVSGVAPGVYLLHVTDEQGLMAAKTLVVASTNR